MMAALLPAFYIRNIDSDYDQNPQNYEKASESLKDRNRI